MILAIEGNDGVGKTTAAAYLGKRLEIPVFADPVRHGLLGALNPREMFLAGNQCNLDLAFFGHHLDFVADRWALSSAVYDGLRGIHEQRYEKLLARYVKTPVHVILLDLPEDVARERVTDRDGRPRRPLDEGRRIRLAFLELARTWGRLGGVLTTLNPWNARTFRSELLRTAERALGRA
jgi:thymidylate kinase